MEEALKWLIFYYEKQFFIIYVSYSKQAIFVSYERLNLDTNQLCFYKKITSPEVFVLF